MSHELRAGRAYAATFQGMRALASGESIIKAGDGQFVDPRPYRPSRGDRWVCGGRLVDGVEAADLVLAGPLVATAADGSAAPPGTPAQ